MINQQHIKMIQRWTLVFSMLVIAGVCFGTLMPMPYDRMPPKAAFIEGYRFIRFEPTCARDVLGNVMMFVPVGVIFWATAASRIRVAWATAVAVAAAGILSLAIEWAQVFIPGRYPSAIDICTNMFGSLIGATIVNILTRILAAIIRRLAVSPTRIESADGSASMTLTLQL